MTTVMIIIVHAGIVIHQAQSDIALRVEVIMAGGPPKGKAYHLLQENKSTYGIIE
jgi:hypothetical protein